MDFRCSYSRNIRKFHLDFGNLLSIKLSDSTVSLREHFQRFSTALIIYQRYESSFMELCVYYVLNLRPLKNRSSVLLE